MTPETTLPLAGYKILDLSRWIAGPSCAMLLGDMGAEVIKVEPLHGEEARRVGPEAGGQSAYVLNYNRNKRGITLNTRNPDALDVLQRLCMWADVLVENFRPGTLAAMGLSAEQLEAWNPKLLHVSITGYGGSGDNPDRPLFNAVAEAESGAMHLTGDDQVGPVVSGVFTADHTAGLYAAFAVSATLASRDRTSTPKRVDISLFHSMLSVLGYPYVAALNGAKAPRDPINRDKLAAPGNCFPTSDGRHLYIDAGTAKLYAALVEAMGNPPLLADTVHSDGEGRNTAVDLIETEIARWTGARTTDEVVAALDAAGVPHGLVHTVNEVAESPRLNHDAHIAEVAYGDNSVRIPGNAIKIDGRRPGVRLAPPSLGQHTDQVLTEIAGYTAAEIEDLRRKGVC